MPKGQAPKLHGAIVNLPFDANKTFSLLPSTENIIMVKLEKKISFKGRAFFEPVRPEKISEALTYSRNNNLLYSDIEIDKNSLLRLLATDFTGDIPIALEEGTRHENHNSKIVLKIKKK